MQLFLSLKTKILSRGKIKVLLCSNSFLESFVTDLKHWKKNTFTWTMWMRTGPDPGSSLRSAVTCALWDAEPGYRGPGAPGACCSPSTAFSALSLGQRGECGGPLWDSGTQTLGRKKSQGRRGWESESWEHLPAKWVPTHEPGQMALSVATKGTVNGPDI